MYFHIKFLLNCNYQYDLIVTESNPPPTEEICIQFNKLRSKISLALDLKQVLASCEFELQALRHQYEASSPGKVFYFQFIVNLFIH